MRVWVYDVCKMEEKLKRSVIDLRVGAAGVGFALGKVYDAVNVLVIIGM